MRRLTWITALSILGAAACGGSSSTGPGSAGTSGGGMTGSAGTTATAGTTGGAGTTGTAGTLATAGTTGSAGTTATAGTTGSAGTTGIAGTIGAAGTVGGAGRGGTVGQAGAGVRGGTTGGAGQAGTVGRGGTGGAAGGATGTGGALVPAPGQYGRRAMLPASNSDFAVGEVNGRIYVVGGYPTSPAATVDTVLVYTIATDTWAQGPAHPIPVHHPVVTGVNGRLYTLGAQTSGADTNRVFELDPTAGTNGTWRELMAMPTARGAGAAAVIGDKIYVVAGRPPAGNAFEVSDISDAAWTALPDLPQAYPDRNHIAATAIGGKIYVAGGRYSGGGFNSPRTDSLDIFDPAAGTWSLGAPMPRPRGGVNGVAANGCFFVWGGEGQGIGEPNDVFPDHDVYNPRTNTWMQLLPLPTPVHGVTGAAFVNGLIYIPGGGIASGGSSGTNIFQVYRPDVRCE